MTTSDTILYSLMVAWCILFVGTLYSHFRKQAKLHDEDDYR